MHIAMDPTTSVLLTKNFTENNEWTACNVAMITQLRPRCASLLLPTWSVTICSVANNSASQGKHAWSCDTPNKLSTCHYLPTAQTIPMEAIMTSRCHYNTNGLSTPSDVKSRHNQLSRQYHEMSTFHPTHLKNTRLYGTPHSKSRLRLTLNKI